jgi:hypothetical protein
MYSSRGKFDNDEYIIEHNAMVRIQEEKAIEKEKNKILIKDYKYLKKLVDELFSDNAVRHFLNHYGIERYSCNLGERGECFSGKLKNVPFKNSYVCDLCNNFINEVNKYEMVYNFLKTKIGPDCARIVVFKTLNEDKIKAKDIQTIKYEMSNYFLENNIIGKIRDIFNDANIMMNMYISFWDSQNRFIDVRFP